MGQGQEFHARKMIMESMANGGWVLLQNVHLSLPFCSEVIDMLVETEHIDNTFRMWVTTEPHSEFPIGLLQMAIKFTNEPPQGIRASLKRSYQVGQRDGNTQRVDTFLMNHSLSLFLSLSISVSLVFHAGLSGLHLGHAVAIVAVYRCLLAHHCAGTSQVRSTRLEYTLRIQSSRFRRKRAVHTESSG